LSGWQDLNLQQPAPKSALDADLRGKVGHLREAGLIGFRADPLGAVEPRLLPRAFASATARAADAALAAWLSVRAEELAALAIVGNV
jgi:hypothetical protein